MNYRFIFSQVPKVHIFGSLFFVVGHRGLSRGIYREPKVRYASQNNCMHIQHKGEGFMAHRERKTEATSRPMSGMERLSLRVSSMINHPIAQERREVRIHRLDTDGEREWLEILGALSEADGIDMTLHDEGGSVTLCWEPSEEDDRLVIVGDEPALEAAPF